MLKSIDCNQAAVNSLSTKTCVQFPRLRFTKLRCQYQLNECYSYFIPYV